MKHQHKARVVHSHSTQPVPATYFFVRHGQTDWNVQGKMQGHTDIPLNDTGRSQAQALAKMLEEIPFTACFSSDLQRASETASIVVADRPLKVVQEFALREFSCGEFEGKSWKEFRESCSLEEHSAIRHKKHAHINCFLSQLATQPLSGAILMVTHSGFMSSMLAVLLDLSHDQLDQLTIENAAFLQIYFSGSEWVLEKTEGIQLPE